jgi:anti-sigma regulatory factor (Ser/Thr protein kinase)
MARQAGQQPRQPDRASGTAGGDGSPELDDLGVPPVVLASFEDAPVLLAEFSGPELVMVSASRMIRPTIAQQDAGMIGRRLADVAPEPGGRQLIDAVNEVYASGIPARKVGWRVLLERRSGDFEELAVSVLAVPAYHPDGSIRGVIIAGFDSASQVRPVQDARAGTGLPGSQRQPAEHGVLALQRYLLPAGLPVLPQIRLAARYLAAPDEQRAGGGWFDVVTLPGGATALAVGNIAGYGPGAVSATWQLRTALQRALLHGAGPLQALARLHAFAAQFPAMRGATACLGVLDPASGDLRYVSAGHPMPIICVPGGSASFLPARTGGPLGIGRYQAALASAVLPPGAVLLLHADGLPSRAAQGLRHGRERMVDAAASVFASTAASAAADAADRMCSGVVERLIRRGHDDDLTVLAAHRLAERISGWSVRFLADPAALRALRSQLREWLQELGVAPLDSIDTELAVYEAAANAIVHGRPRDGPATVTVQAELDGTGVALIRVADRGQWRPGGSPDAGRERGGRGLSVISKITDELSIAPSPNGTTITMRRHLSKPVTIGLASQGGDRVSRPG